MKISFFRHTFQINLLSVEMTAVYTGAGGAGASFDGQNNTWSDTAGYDSRGRTNSWMIPFVVKSIVYKIKQLYF